MDLHDPDTPDLRTLGGRIRAVRKARKLTVVAAAREVGISRVSFSQWESNVVKDPGVTSLLKFTELCEVDLNWLLDRKGTDPEIVRPEFRNPRKLESTK